MDHPCDSGLDPCIDSWDAGECIAFLEADGGEAPEYDLETDSGLAMLRQDCKLLAARQTEAA